MMYEFIAFDKAVASSFFAGKALDVIFNYVKEYKDRSNSESIEYKIIELLNETLEEFCNQNNLEFDNNAIISTYLYSVSQLNNFDEQSVLIKILEDATGMKYDKSQYDLWIFLFKKNISKPKYLWLFNIIMLNHKCEEEVRNNTKVFAKIEVTHNEIVIEDLEYLEYLKRNSFVINESFYINEDTICLIIPKHLERMLAYLTHNFNYNYKKDYKIRLYKIP